MAVGLAVLVGRWSIGQSQSATENFVSQAELDETCSQITVSAFPDCAPGNAKANEMTLINKGYLTIKKIKLQTSDCTGESPGEWYPDELTEGLKPQEKKENVLTSNSGVTSSCKKILILPMVTIKDKEVGCSEKRIELNLVC
ncbi:MAG: hypothetical protein AABW58_04010 [Nanoarchaeota archaeon]